MRSVCRPPISRPAPRPWPWRKKADVIGVAGLLHDIVLVDQLLQHTTERLLGNAQDIEQIGDLQPGITVDKVNHAVMGAAEAELRQHRIGIANKIAIGEEQQLDDIPAQIAGSSALARALIGRASRT